MNTTKDTASSLCEECVPAGRLSAQTGGQPLFKQCRVCKFTRQIKMFVRHKMYNDGYESECRYCKAARRKQKLLRSTVAMCVLVCCGFARGQVPEYLGETYVKAAAVLMRPNASQAAVWFAAGFGTYPITLNANTGWQLTIGQDPYKYAWFRIREPATSLADDYWVTEKATWATYAANKDVAALKAKSWRFANFVVSSDYVLPDLPDPITWEDRTEELTVGHAIGSTLIVVWQQGETSWEWTIRGAKGLDVWQPAIDRQAAMTAAARALED
jgi:hypothetical protein